MINYLFELTIHNKIMDYIINLMVISLEFFHKLFLYLICQIGNDTALSSCKEQTLQLLNAYYHFNHLGKTNLNLSVNVFI